MEVILLERVEKLGAIGDVVKVKDGFARNYLIPQQKALLATQANREVFESQRKDIEAQNAERKKDAEKVHKKVDGEVVVLIRQAGEDGRLFGSVTARDIAREVSKKDDAVSHRHVVLDQPIKYSGIYDIRLVLHAEVTAIVRVNVARTEGEAKEALVAEKTGKAKPKSEAAEQDESKETPSETAIVSDAEAPADVANEDSEAA